MAAASVGHSGGGCGGEETVDCLFALLLLETKVEGGEVIYCSCQAICALPLKNDSY